MATQAHQQGNLVQVDYLENIGGINATDSPFVVKDEQCLESYNFDYVSTGGIRKVKGMQYLYYPVADAQLKTLGLSMYVDPSGNKTLVRAAGTKIQKLDSTTYASTNLTADTLAAGSDFLNSSSTVPVVFSQFNGANADRVTGTGNVLWMAGGGLSTITGMCSTSKVTTNGAAIATGSITVADAGGAGSGFGATPYFYGVSLYKGSTQVTSNVALDKSVTPTAGHNISVDLSGITAYDTTKYTQIWIYRSAASGATGFTTGDIVAKIAYNGTTYTISSGGGSIAGAVYTDTSTSIASTTNIPRANNTLLDQSMLPSGTYTTSVLFKRRLVTANQNVIYLSDLNKPESWPTGNAITVPSGGNITGLAVIYFSSPSTAANDEYLIIFKEREMWVLTGDALIVDSSNPGNSWKLKFIDYVGCPNQSLIVNANGYIAWVDYRGIYLWDGNGKPTYCSRLIETLFQDNGDLSTGLLPQGFGVYYRKYNQIVWVLSHLTKGTQSFVIKMDLRLSIPTISANLMTNKIMEAVFTYDIIPNGLFYGVPGGIYAGVSLIGPSETSEDIFIGDGRGYLFKLYNGYSTVDFNYKTKFLDQASPGVAKRYHKVLVYIQDLGNTNNLTLNYWANYKTSPTVQSSKSQPMSIVGGTSLSVWDAATWDVSAWDDFIPSMRTLTFNLSSEQNNIEGDCLQLQFKDSFGNSPVVIYGFSIIYSNLGTRH